METYYNPEDLSRFEEIGKDAPEMAKKFFEYYQTVFEEGDLTEREKASSLWRWPMPFNAPIVLIPTPRRALKKAPICQK